MASFREKAPISNYLPDEDLFADGNPNLQMSSIESYDARFEWFPAPGEILSAGIFYKKIRAPIELYRVDFADSVTWINRDEATVMGIEFEGVPMYNLVQGSAPGKPFHHKGIGSGYILRFGDTRAYVSGDTECVPEMKALRNIDIAFVAMNPPRTMSTIEGAQCVAAFRPKIVYPYHYRGSNLQEFTDALKGVPVEIRRFSPVWERHCRRLVQWRRLRPGGQVERNR